MENVMKFLEQLGPNRVNEMGLAFSLTTNQRLYDFCEDTLAAGQWVNFEGSAVYVNYKRMMEAVAVQSDGEKKYGLRITVEGAMNEYGMAFFEKLGKSEWFEKLEGHLLVRYKKMADKEFFQIRSFLEKGAEVGSEPSLLLRENAGTPWKWMFATQDGVELFLLNTNENRLYPRVGLMKDNRLMELVMNCEKKRAMMNDNLLRNGVERFFPHWNFVTVWSIGEHHFHYNSDTKQVHCYLHNGASSKQYTIGKGLKRVASVMGIPKEITDVDLTDANIKTFTQWIENYGIGTLEVVEGERIVELYDYNSYDNGVNNGSLGGSCMAKSTVKTALRNAYVGNAKMLVMWSYDCPDKIIGRANLWVCEDGTKFMDRIYSSEANQERFKEWARENGYVYKKWQSFDTPANIIDLDGTERRKPLVVRIDTEFLKNYEDNATQYELPYMDTFKFFNAETGEFVNFFPTNEDGRWFQCESTNGWTYDEVYTNVDEDDDPIYQWYI